MKRRDYLLGMLGLSSLPLFASSKKAERLIGEGYVQKVYPSSLVPYKEINIGYNKLQFRTMRWWDDSDTTQIAVVGPKWSGKSYIGAYLIFTDAHTYPLTHYFIAGDNLTNLRRSTKATCDEVLEATGIKAKYVAQDNYYILENGSRVYFFSCEERETDPKFRRFGSVQMTRGMIDGVGSVSPVAIDALYETLGRWRNKEFGLTKKLLLVGVPSKYTKELFYTPSQIGLLPDWKKLVMWKKGDSPHEGKYYKALKKICTKEDFSKFAYGSFEYV